MSRSWRCAFGVLTWAVSVWIGVLGCILPMFFIDAPREQGNTTVMQRKSVYLLASCAYTGNVVFLMNADSCEREYSQCEEQRALITGLRVCMLCGCTMVFVVLILACVRTCVTWPRWYRFAAVACSILLVPTAASLGLFFATYSGCRDDASLGQLYDRNAKLGPAIAAIILLPVKLLLSAVIYARFARSDNAGADSAESVNDPATRLSSPEDYNALA